ncbi:CARDB domain-containing protein, partial [Anaerolinea sp.]|uniref:CARDB domain-containing protein n=1 Tax=Anaerolinea sp. TaxID=1872519 RepID=UPI002ACD2118
AGQPNVLPIQVVNLGKSTVVLGNMTVSAEGAELQNNTVLVGALDPGGFYTLDATFIPPQAGEMTVKVVLNYTDDFNQPRQVEQVIPVTVQESAPIIEPGMPSEGGEVPVQPVQETFLQKVWRFIRGLLGLDSAPPQPVAPEGEVPAQEFESVPVPPLKGP